MDKDCCLLCVFSTLAYEDGEPDIIKLIVYYFVKKC